MVLCLTQFVKWPQSIHYQLIWGRRSPVIWKLLVTCNMFLGSRREGGREGRSRNDRNNNNNNRVPNIVILRRFGKNLQIIVSGLESQNLIKSKYFWKLLYELAEHVVGMFSPHDLPVEKQSRQSLMNVHCCWDKQGGSQQIQVMETNILPFLSHLLKWKQPAIQHYLPMIFCSSDNGGRSQFFYCHTKKCLI